MLFVVCVCGSLFLVGCSASCLSFVVYRLISVLVVVRCVLRLVCCA